MMKSARPLALILISSLIFNTIPAHTEEGDTALTSGLKSIQSSVGTTGQFFGAVGASAMQMQQLGSYYSTLLNQNALLQSGQGELNQIKMNMAMAMEEVKGCAQKAEKSISKFKKAKLPIVPAEPTCTNYGEQIDSIKANIVKISEANTRYSCVLSFQSKMKQIADSSKGVFSKLTTAAQESWNTYDQIITLHKNISEKLDAELNGENGYKAQLAKLEELSQELLAALDARGENANNGALSRRLDDLERFRNDAANKWQFNIMQDTENCFFNDNTHNCGTGTASPLQCVVQTITGYGKDSPSAQAQNKANQEQLESALRMNAGLVRTLDLPANIDVKNPGQFEKFSKARFKEILQAKMKNLNSRNFIGKANKDEIAGFFKFKYEECYNVAIDRFHAGLKSEGNPYRDALNMVEENEKNILVESKLLLKRAQNQMNNFRTAFNKVYQNDLPQFSANCTSQTDPYLVVDCIKKLSATLDAGLSGTQQSIQLSDRSTFTSVEGTTTLRIQALTLGTDGKPTTHNSAVQCVGFKECLNFLDRSKEAHDGEIQNQTMKQTQFVNDHNKTMDAVMKGIGDQYSFISQLTQQTIAGLNSNFAELGIKGTITADPVQGEPLVKNEKTGIYDMPTDMQKALAGQGGSVLEIKDPEAIQSAMNRRMKELGDMAKKAYEKKELCSVSAKAYKSIAAQLPTDCRADLVCQSSRINRLVPSMEDLFRKSAGNNTKNSKNEIANRLRDCMSDAKSDAREVEEDDSAVEDAESTAEALKASWDKKQRDYESATESNKDALKSGADKAYDAYNVALAAVATAKRERAKAKKTGSKELLVDGRDSCTGSAFADLDALASSSRDSIGSANTELSANLRDLMDACSRYRKNEELYASDVESACSALKSNAESVKIEDDGETIDGLAKETGSSTSDLVNEAD